MCIRGMNVKFISPLLESTVNVLSTMAMVAITPGKPHIKDEPKTLGEITGLIKLSGDEIQGSLAISFSEAAILDITEKMLQEKVESIDDTVQDLVGEITNMITGSAKRSYSEQGMEFDLTLPSTVLGKGQPMKHCVTGEPIVLPFDTDAGKMYVEFCFN